jgi:tetratricopeptide (TPR) repeat protein
MHVTIINGPIERTLQLIRPAAYAIILSLASLALLSCAVPVTQPAWDPLQPAQEQTDSRAPAAGIERSSRQLSPAMADLIGRADAAIEQQRWSEASALLERALRVNPKQAEAWTRMAVVNLGTHNPQQSLQMARKSNRHAKASRSLMAYNWLLMSRAYEQLGQPEQAQQALAESRRLQDGNE